MEANSPSTKTLAAGRQDGGQSTPAPPPITMQQALARQQHQLFQQLYPAFGAGGGYGQQFGGQLQQPPTLPPHNPSGWLPLPGSIPG